MSDHVQAVTHQLLVRDLCKVTEWEVLGIYLGLDESEITEIERDHQSNARRRIAMFAKWLEKDVDFLGKSNGFSREHVTDKAGNFCVPTEGKVLHY